MKPPTILSTLPKLNVPDGQQTIHDYDKENKHPLKHVFVMPTQYTTKPQKPYERIDFELRFKSAKKTAKSVRKSAKKTAKSVRKPVKKTAKSVRKPVKKPAKSVRNQQRKQRNLYESQ